MASFRFTHSAAGWKELREKLARLCRTGHRRGDQPGRGGGAVGRSWTGGLSQSIPKARSAIASARRKSGIKDDQLDAWSLADALRVDGHGWKLLGRTGRAARELRLLCRDEIALIEQRTALVNQLQAALREYYPAAL